MKSSAGEQPDAQESAADDAEPTSTGTGIAIVSSASYIGLIASLIRAILLANILGPTRRGILATARLVASYCSHSHLGVLHGMSKLMPVALGKQERDRAEELQNTGFTTTTCLAVVAGLGVCAFAMLDLGHLAMGTRLALALGGVLVIATHGTTFFTSVLRSFGHFDFIGRALVLTSVAEFALAIGLGLRYGAGGAVAGFVLAQLVVLVYLVARSPVRPMVRLRWPEVAALLTSGVPLLLMMLADQLYRTVDMALIVKFERVRALGLYGIGSTLAAMIYTIPSSVAYVLFPAYLKSYGRDGVEGLRSQLRLATIGLSSLMPVLAGVVYLLCPTAIRLLLPEYVEGIGAIQILLVGSALLGLPVATDQALITFDREKHLIAFRGIGALVIAGATFALVHTSLEGSELLRRVAMGACAGYALTGGLSLVTAFSVYEDRKLEIARETALCFLPLVFCLGALWGAQRVSWAVAGSLSDLARAAVALPTFLLMCAPLLVYLQRRTGLVAQVVGILLRRRTNEIPDDTSARTEE